MNEMQKKSNLEVHKSQLTVWDKKEESHTNKELTELVKQIQLLPFKNRERRKLLNKLIVKIQKHQNLKKFACYRNLRDFQDLYADALGDCLTYISQNIEKYDPKYAFMAWVNQTLDFKFRTAFNQRYRNKIQSVLLEPFKLMNIPAQGQENEETIGLLRELIQDDPERILKNRKMKKHDISLQQILLMYLNNKKWKEIAEELQIKISTAESFLRRSLEKPEVKEYFYKYLCD